MKLEGVKEGLDKHKKRQSLSKEDWVSLPVETHGFPVFAFVCVCARARVSVCARVARLPTRQAAVASVRTSKLLAHLLLSVGR